MMDKELFGKTETMINEKITKITNDFYSCFCEAKLSADTSAETSAETSADTSSVGTGVKLICSEARDRVLKGYGSKYSIYILCKGEDYIVSFAPKYRSVFEKFSEAMDAKELIASISENFPLKCKQLMIFREERVFDYKNARMLRPEDYPLYEKFFKTVHPSVKNIDWLKEYYDEKTEKELMFGYIADGELVSVCDAPDMPYMEDHIQHTGIVTIEEHRRKGYARCCAALAAHHHIESGLVPQWDCAADNIASIELAKCIGFEEYGKAFIFEE